MAVGWRIVFESNPPKTAGWEIERVMIAHRISLDVSLKNGRKMFFDGKPPDLASKEERIENHNRRPGARKLRE